MRRAVGDIDALLDGIRSRQRRALGRAASILENRSDGYLQLIAALYANTGSARVVGVTGPPGAGKSTLVERLARACRERGDSVGILAVDPTSPFTGGALLGDRVRMQGLFDDEGVFIRSLATRGAMGGVSSATRDVADLLDAAGFDWVLIETVGVGQDETDVVRTVDSVVVVTVPGLGDEIQAIKAGIMEIADVFVVNKADRQGADRTVRDLHSALTMVEDDEDSIPILKTVAVKNEGVEELLAFLLRHHSEISDSGELEQRRFRHLQLRVEEILKQRILTATRETVDVEARLRRAYASRQDPYAVSDLLFTEVMAGSGRKNAKESEA